VEKGSKKKEKKRVDEHAGRGETRESTEEKGVERPCSWNSNNGDNSGGTFSSLRGLRCKKEKINRKENVMGANGGGLEGGGRVGTDIE